MADKLTLKAALLMVAKQSISASFDATLYRDTLEPLYLDGLPGCKFVGINNHRSCGFVTCPACEVGRRVKFGLHVASILNTVPQDTEMFLVHQRVAADELYELNSHSAFNASATIKFFYRLNNVVAMRVAAGFDLDCRSWVFDRVAVIAGKRPVVKAPTTARGVVVISNADIDTAATSPRMPEFVGHYAAFLEHAVNLGAPAVNIIKAVYDLDMPYVGDSVREAKARWQQQDARLHLVKLFKFDVATLVPSAPPSEMSE